MGEAVGVDEFVDGGEDVLVAGDVLEADGAVLFDPGFVSEVLSENVGEQYHGRLSSASTGRLAALRLPCLASDEKTMSLDWPAGASTSISSS